jgi:hypothetical protein
VFSGRETLQWSCNPYKIDLLNKVDRIPNSFLLMGLRFIFRSS